MQKINPLLSLKIGLIWAAIAFVQASYEYLVILNHAPETPSFNFLVLVKAKLTVTFIAGIIFGTLIPMINFWL